MQSSLEDLARGRALALGPDLSVAIVALDNATGEVMARVASADYFDERRAGQVDMTQALRSPGSALKPFIYGIAFEDGIAHPETMIEDRPTRFGLYAPDNGSCLDPSALTSGLAQHVLDKGGELVRADVLGIAPGLGGQPAEQLDRTAHIGTAVVVQQLGVERAPVVGILRGMLDADLARVAQCDRHRLLHRLRPLSLPLHRLRKQKAKLNSLKTMLTFTRRR